MGKSRDDRIKKYLEIVEKKFESWHNGGRGTFKTVTEVQSKPQIVVKHKKTEQAHFCLGFRAFSFFDKRKHALSILSTILGGGMSSRLFIQVRERRGLCYYISTGRELYHDVGNIVTQAGVTVDRDKVKEAIQTVLKEHRKVARGDIKKSELEKAKKLVSGRMLLSMEDSFNVANFFGTRKILQNELQMPEEVIGELEKVTVSDVVTLAAELFKPEKLNFAIIGPFEDSKDFESVLSI